MGTHDTTYVVAGAGTMVFLPMVLLLPLLICAIFVHPFSKAFIAGIASARDPEHRLTPQSPWYFFDLCWQRVMRRTIAGQAVAYLSIFLALCLIPFESFGLPSMSAAVSLFFILIMLGWTFAALSIAFYWAPKISSPIALTFIGTMFGAIYTLLILSGSTLMLVDVAYHYQSSEALILFGSSILVCMVTSTIFLTIWRGVRKEASYEWFRFES